MAEETKSCEEGYETETTATTKSKIHNQKASAKTTAKKTTATKPASTKSKKVAKDLTLDDLTTLLWAKLEKAEIKDNLNVAVQFRVLDKGIFFISVRDGKEKKSPKQIFRCDAYVETDADEIVKFALGRYDYVAAVRDGVMNFYGNLTVLLRLQMYLNNNKSKGSQTADSLCVWLCIYNR